MIHLKRYWKQIVGVVITVLVVAVGMKFAFADEVGIVIATGNVHQSTWDSGTIDTVTATVTGVTPGQGKLTWTTSNAEVVALTDNGNGTATVYATGAGRAELIATYTNGDYIKTRSLIVSVKLNRVDTQYQTLEVGSGTSLSTNYSNSNTTPLTWTSSDENIIRVSGAGTSAGMCNIEAVGSGVATVKAMTPSPDGQVVEYVVIVPARFTKHDYVEVTASQYVNVFDLGITNTLNAENVYWGSLDNGSGTVEIDAFGNVYGTEAGIKQIYIYPKYEFAEIDEFAHLDTLSKIINAFGDTVNVRINFGINGGNKTMSVGDTATLTVNVDDSYKNRVNWTSSNTSVATVDSRGNIVAVSGGTAEITATLDGKIFPNDTATSHRATITVVVIDNFKVSETEHYLNREESFTLTAIPTDSSDYTTISWLSSDDSIATVKPSENNRFEAVVEGIKPGTATITAVQQTKDGVNKYATCTVYVREKVEDVTMNEKEIEVTVGSSYQLSLIFNSTSGNTPDNLAVKWVSSDESIATVERSTNINGLVTGISGGDVVVSAITEDGIQVASCKVHVRVPVTGIILTKHMVETSMSMENYQLSYTILPEGDGVNRNVTWSSSNEEVATVDSNGLVTFVAPGKATIICQTVDTGVDGSNLIDTCEFYVNQPVTSVKLDYTDVTLRIGDTFRLTAEVNPEDATNKTLWWSSSNTDVITVDETGFITASGSGNATVIVQSADSGVIDVCNVSVYQPVETVTLNTHEMSVRKGTIFWLNAVAGPEGAVNKTIIWTSSDESIATVDASGMVTALNPGECSIIATSQDTGISDKCVLRVTEPVTGIYLNATEAYLYTGEKFVIIPTVEPLDADDKSVTYLSSDPAVATVDSNGIVTGVSGGSAIILVTTVERGLVASMKVTVYEFVTSIKINNSSPYINNGVTRRLTVDVAPKTATNQGVTWSSSNPSIIRVSSNGNITAVGYGTAIITATATDGSGISDSVIITSVRPVQSVTVNPTSVTVMEGGEVTVNVTVTPNNATFKDVDWVSSDPTIATVDFNGTITGVTAGVCYVTATSTDGNNLQARVKVTVRPAIPATSVVINSSSITMLPGQSRTLTARLKPTKSTDGYTWVSGDTSVATVDANGNVYARGQGVTEIYCIADSGIESSCEVIVLALNATSITLEQYDYYNLDVFGATESIKWYTNNARVATVTNGKVIARSVGTCYITANVNGKILYCKVTVTKINK
ncbi:MAG: Ig-like domain-containing protein [Lachnospiraceae bacterium]|nr:Ig-like domain-containing protein [Lachnospiraceae bacterium]